MNYKTVSMNQKSKNKAINPYMFKQNLTKLYLNILGDIKNCSQPNVT